MILTTENCIKCGIPLYESVSGSVGRKIFRSFGTKTIDGKEVHYCMDCYKKLNTKYMEENEDGNRIQGQTSGDED